MPLKPYRTIPYRRSSLGFNGVMISKSSRTHHDSGSDSGTEIPAEYDSTEEDVPGQIFEILKSISTEIFVKEYSNHEVVTVFACLLEKCLTREAYSPCQKQLITGWLQKLKTLWNPPHIKKATDYKKRYIFSVLDFRVIFWLFFLIDLLGLIAPVDHCDVQAITGITNPHHPQWQHQYCLTRVEPAWLLLP